MLREERNVCNSFDEGGEFLLKAGDFIVCCSMERCTEQQMARRFAPEGGYWDGARKKADVSVFVKDIVS